MPGKAGDTGNGWALVASALILVSLTLFASGLASFMGGYWLVVNRVTVKVNPSEWGFSPLESIALGLALAVSALFITRTQRVKFHLKALGYVIACMETALMAATILFKLSPSLRWKAFSYIALERSLWTLIGAVGIAAIIASNTIVLVSRIIGENTLEPGILRRLRLALRGLVLEDHTTEEEYLEKAYLILALLVASLSVFLAHTQVFNPGLKIVSTDTYYNMRWIKIFQDSDGFLESLRDTMSALRPLYILFLYILWHLSTPIDITVVLDVLVPLLGFILLSIVSYHAARTLSLPHPGIASLATVLYWAPFFVYGGFQTNLLALPLALEAYTLLVKGRLIPSSILTYILGLWHPWTMVYYVAAMLLYLTASLKAPRASRDKYYAGLASVTLASTASLATLLALLIWSGSPGSLGALYRPATPGYLALDKLVFIFYIYVWGAALRPEIQIPASLALLDNERASTAWPLIIPSLGFVFLPPTGGFRLLMLAPYPIMLAMAGRRVFNWIVLPAALATWFYLIVNSPPA